MNDNLRIINAFITDPEKRTIYLSQLGCYKWMSDEKFLKMQFKNVFGYELDLENPQTYSEKLQWLKLYDRKDEYTKLVDKYEVKKIVAGKIGNKYIIPTIGVWNNFRDIDFEQLPNEFVLKCTHDSGGNVICKNKQEFDFKKAKAKINRCLKNNYYYQNREWPYKNVRPRIIAEKYMVDDSGYELKDYKFFCFNGEAKVMFIATDRSRTDTETKFDFYDMNFNHLALINGHPNNKKLIDKPSTFEEMKKLAECLSVGYPQVRVDFYEINGQVYFGEMTFYHWSGFKKFEPREWDKIFGDWIELPK